MLTKKELAGILETHANNIRVANVVRILARGGNLAESFRSIIATRSNEPFLPTVNLLEDKSRLIHTVDELYKTVLRAAITESYELTKDYCIATGQFESFKQQSWSTVFWFLRNCFNHNFCFKFKPSDLKLLPVKWGVIEISAALEGKLLSQEIFPDHAAIDLLSEVDEFVLKGIQ